MGLLKFRNAGYLPILKDAIIESVNDFFQGDESLLAGKFKEIPNFTLQLKSKLLTDLSEESIISCLDNPAGVILIESWLEERFQILDKWQAFSTEEKEKYPSKDFYNSELGKLFKNDDDDDEVLNELCLRFIPVSIKICERFIYPFLLNQSIQKRMDLSAVGRVISALEHRLNYTIISHWMHLYCTFNDDGQIVIIQPNQ